MNQAFAKTAGAPALIGRVLAGRYLLREAIAEGGMATVYRATRIVAQDEVAVKVMHPQFTSDRGFALRFRQEAKIAWKLSHPSIVRVIDHGAEQNHFFMVMELLEGEDLFDVLRHEKRLDPGVARRIVAEICDGLAVAHEQGIVHRDLKPENVYLTRSKGGRVEVKVLDFGVAKMMLPDARASNESEPILTAMGALLGTPEYLSPEMCRGEPVGPGADLYACGALLYALLTGRPPFVTERPLEVTAKHVLETPRPPSDHVPGLDPALDAIVLKALAKQPRDRQPSAAALAEALRALGPMPELPGTLVRSALRKVSGSEAVTLALPPLEDDATLRADIASVRTVALEGDPPNPSARPAKPVELEATQPLAPFASERPAPLTQPDPAPKQPPEQHPVARAPSSAAAPAEAPAAKAKPTVSEPPATTRAPSTVRPHTAAQTGRTTSRLVIAAVVLVATFLAGVAVGRWSAPAAPAGASPGTTSSPAIR